MPSAEPSWSTRTRSMDETVALGEAIAAHVRAGDLIALVGELGAGKTQLVRGLANGMGVERNVVVSPTFVIAQEYTPERGAGEGNAKPRLIHIDAYRIQKLDELESIGWEITGDVLGGELRENSVVAIEWADRLDELVGRDRLEVRLSHVGGDERAIELVAHGNWRERFDAMVRGIEVTRSAKPQAAGTAPCPICGKPVAAGDERFPFCSKRCKTIDLGKWISGNYVISRPIDQSDLEEV